MHHFACACRSQLSPDLLTYFLAAPVEFKFGLESCGNEIGPQICRDETWTKDLKTIFCRMWCFKGLREAIQDYHGPLVTDPGISPTLAHTSLSLGLYFVRLSPVCDSKLLLSHQAYIFLVYHCLVEFCQLSSLKRNSNRVFWEAHFKFEICYFL